MQIDTDVDESKSILSYMRRCCLCFLCSCCCDGDKDVVRDNTRKKRVKEYVHCSLVFLYSMKQTGHLLFLLHAVL